MKLAKPITGGCACGKIRYEADADPMFGGLCCCRACQQASGTGFHSVLGVPRSAFRVTQGEPKFYESQADSGGTTRRAFCPDCGSPLFGQPEGAPVTGIAVGSLDDPSGFEPAVVVFAEARLPWVALPEGLTQFPKMPPRG